MANNKRASKRPQREISSVKSVETTPTPSVTPDDHAESTPQILSVQSVAPLTAEIETFTSLRDKLVQRMRDEISAAEETLAELNQQFATLFPELASDEQASPKAKKPKPKIAPKPESVSSDESASAAA